MNIRELELLYDKAVADEDWYTVDYCMVELDKILKEVKDAKD